MRTVLMTACLVISPLSAQASELYRWVDSTGIVHYTDVPPPKSAQAETRKFSGQTGSGDALPYETRRAQQNFPVTLYVADNCVEACNQARSLLDKRGIPYTEKSLKTKAEFDAFRQLSGSDGVPVLSVGRNFLKGFLAEQWQGELDIAGYPKTAPYRPPGKLSPPVTASPAADRAY